VVVSVPYCDVLGLVKSSPVGS